MADREDLSEILSTRMNNRGRTAELASNHRHTQVYPWAEQYVGIYRTDTLIYGDEISLKDKQSIKSSQ